MKQIDFTYHGVLPISSTPWHIKAGGGYIWFISEDAGPYVLMDGEIVRVVDAAAEPDAPMILPKAGA